MGDNFRKIFKKDISITILACFIVGIMLFLAVSLGGKMYNIRNFSSMAFQVSEFAILSLGMSLVMMLGGIDLSIIANANLSGIIAGYVMCGKLFDTSDMSPAVVIFLAVLAALICATLLGALNGVMIAKFSAPPMVATLGTMIFYNGIGMAITGGQGIVGFPNMFLKFGSGSVFNIPYVMMVLFIVAVVLMFVMERTTFGRKLYMMGENHTAARFSAIKNEKLIIITYSVVGLLAGIASLMIVSRVNSAKVGYGDTYLLQAILVAVLGGVSPSGGKGKIFGVLLAVFSTQMLSSAFTQWQFSPYSKKLVWGAMLVIIMLINLIVDKKMQTVVTAKKQQ